MSKAKIIGMNTPPDKGNKQRLRWQRQMARQEVRSHDSWWIRMQGCVDEGCLQAAVTAGIKKRKK